MSERIYANFSYVWAGYSPDLAVCWYRSLEGGEYGVQVHQAVGLAYYGNLNSRILEGKFRRFVPPIEGVPGIVTLSDTPTSDRPADDGTAPNNPPPPPDHATIREAWAAVDPAPAQDVDCSPKQPGESHRDFLQRIATAYLHYQATTGKPTAEISERAGVTKTSVGRWVREARLLDLLPPSSQGGTQ